MALLVLSKLILYAYIQTSTKIGAEHLRNPHKFYQDNSIYIFLLSKPTLKIPYRPWKEPNLKKAIKIYEKKPYRVNIAVSVLVNPDAGISAGSRPLSEAPDGPVGTLTNAAGRVVEQV